jgi:hypothetical protein
VLTAAGAVRVVRWHGRCPACGQPGFAADGVLGLEGWLTARARRMACLAGVHDPFRRAEQLLAELAGWSVAAETLRRRCHAEAAAARRHRAGRGGLPEQFAAAAGDRELHLDAGKVNTDEGWRDVKLAVYAGRARAAAATADDYEQRDLPAPAVRGVVAEVEGVRAFGARCRAEAERLGVTAAARLSVVGDGAGWIWDLAGEHFAGAAQVLDVYHATEHLAAAGRAAFGEGPELQRWLDAARRRLVGDGYAGVCEALRRPAGAAGAAAGLADAAGGVLNYFCGHRERLGYAVRLLRGQVIGSGAVEGAIKQLVNLRLKRTGARWRAVHVGAFVELRAMADSAEWSEYWAALSA